MIDTITISTPFSYSQIKTYNNTDKQKRISYKYYYTVSILNTDVWISRFLKILQCLSIINTAASSIVLSIQYLSLLTALLIGQGCKFSFIYIKLRDISLAMNFLQTVIGAILIT